MSMEKQEVRDKVLNFRVTPSEKSRIKWVAEVRGIDVSELLRCMSVEAILAEHGRLVKVVASLGAAA